MSTTRFHPADEHCDMTALANNLFPGNNEIIEPSRKNQSYDIWRARDQFHQSFYDVFLS